jgi:phosphoribosylformylglycinamidine synthase
VGGYGNCLGLPNIGGEAVFDASYLGNPLVNALCVGVLRHEDLHLAKASGVGNQVILYGAKTGGDGIGGVSVLASETFESTGPAKRPSVQVGDPFQEKLLIECTLEIFAAGLVAGIQDLGGAGLSCATSELASAGDGGMHVELDRVPLRDSTLAPEEILMSESQERMMAVVEPDDVDAFLAICAKWDVDATVVGEVTDGDRLQIDWHGERVVDVPPRSVAHDGPTYHRPFARPSCRTRSRPTAPRPCPARPPATSCATRSCGCSPRRTSATSPGSPTSTTATCRATPSSPSPTTRAWCGSTRRPGSGSRWRRTATAASPGSTRTPARSWRSRSRSATWPSPGRRPLAISDCLNFGSPEDPDVMWQFAEACRGLKDACLVLGIPVTGGNVSLYNQTGETAILPTPVVATLGVIDDVTKRTRTGFVTEGETVLLLGETREELSGSEWAHVVHGHLGGRPPAVDLAAEQALASLMVEAARDGAVTSAHDVSDGGLAQVLAESVMRHGVGARVTLEGDPFVALFAESSARAVVTVADDRRARSSGLRVVRRARRGDRHHRRHRARRGRRLLRSRRRPARRLDGDAAYRPGLSTRLRSSSCQSNAARDRSARPSGSPGSSSITRRTSSAGRSAWT